MAPFQVGIIRRNGPPLSVSLALVVALMAVSELSVVSACS